MGNRFASGKNAIAQCDRCDFRFKLKELRRLVIKTKNINMLVCPVCWEPDQPQLQLGMYPVDDPQALRNPRRDNSYIQGGLTGLQLLFNSTPSVDSDGTPSEGSRQIQWGWNPVGMGFTDGLTLDNLVGSGQIGTVTIST